MAPEEHFLHKRVAEELKSHPPFGEMEGGLLLELAENIEVHYLAPGQWLFHNGDTLHPFIYFAAKGTVALWRDSVLIDHVEQGELLGLRSLFQQGQYKAGAKPLDGKDALVYAIPVELARARLLNNPDTAHFFQLDWKGNSDNFIPSGTSLRRLMKRKEGNFVLPISEDRQKLIAGKALALHPHTPIFEVARAMTTQRTDAAVLVDECGTPRGIVTDKDMRMYLGAEYFDRHAAVSTMMTQPVKTFAEDLSYADAMVAMVEQRIHHLVVTQDGTDDSPLVGIISDHEILLEQALNPTVIVKRMEKAQSASELELAAEKVEQLRLNYVRANVNTGYLLKMMTQFYAGLYANALRLAEKTIGPAPCGYAWIALGSLGRGEQLMRTDQDHALVMAEEGHETYFVRLAQNVSGTMQQLGFAEDHYGVSATNSLWQGSPTQWKNRIRSWITAGEGDALLQLSILLDARLIHGDLNLGLEVFNELYRGVGGNNVLLHTMAQDALRNPSPLGLFKQFKLEATGQFDLKLRAILPFIDAAKVLAGFAQKAHLSGTRERLEAIRDGSNEELVSSAQHAYEILLEMRSRFSAKDNEHGRYINPEDLDTLDRQLLRNVLKTLEALQSHLKLKFKL